MTNCYNFMTTSAQNNFDSFSSSFSIVLAFFFFCELFLFRFVITDKTKQIRSGTAAAYLFWWRRQFTDLLSAATIQISLAISVIPERPNLLSVYQLLGNTKDLRKLLRLHAVSYSTIRHTDCQSMGGEVTIDPSEEIDVAAFMGQKPNKTSEHCGIPWWHTHQH